MKYFTDRKAQASLLRNSAVIAVPVALQSLLQSSFSIVDQVMAGQLGESVISGIGIGGRFAGIFSFSLSAIVSAGSIMMAQFLGQNNHRSLARSYRISFWCALGLAIVLGCLCFFFPSQIAGFYIQDPAVIRSAAQYLQIFALSFIPAAMLSLFSALLRCLNRAVIPMLVTFVSAVLNTLLNMGFIFGLAGFPRMGAAGVAAASVISMTVGWAILGYFVHREIQVHAIQLPWEIHIAPKIWNQYIRIVLPFLITEFAWVLGENVYGSIYGHLGTEAFTAMTIANTVIGLVIGALSGLEQAASILCGKALGKGNTDLVLSTASFLIKAGFVCAGLLALITAASAPFYVSLYAVQPTVRHLTVVLLYIFAVYTPVKTTNMILAGGILRAGGKTKYTMYLDLCGTWLIGVPLGLLCLHAGLTVSWVYAILSVEEVVRMLASFVIYKKRIWMQTLQKA